MLKKIKLKNSTILLIGIVFVLIGVSIGFVEYFTERRNKTYSEMNLLLFESEIPSNMESDEELEENKEQTEDEVTQDSPSGGVSSEEKPTETQYDYIGILEIPKINLKRGFLNLNSKYNKVNYNITVINGSTFPDEENNNLILAAHSGVCSVCFFDRLFNLSLGDVANLYYDNNKYSYKLVNTYEVEKDGTVPIYRDYNKNVLTLITCTRYSNTKQTVFIFELS